MNSQRAGVPPRFRVVFVITVVVISLLSSSLWAQSKDSRPNVLFILVDDQSPWDLRIYNPDSALETPTIDKLASEGMVIDGAYHMGSFMGAVCTPSRHMIMSGRTVWHLPISPGVARAGKTKPRTAADPIDSPLCPAHLEQYTIPAVFKASGYATMRTCKEGNSYEAANRQFEVRHDATRRGGTAESGSAWHADRVLDYFHQRQTDGDRRPFLIYFGFSHPHDERNGTPELLAKYGAVNHTDPSAPPAINPLQPLLPANYLPAHPFHHGHPKLRDEVAVSGVWERRDEATIRNELGREFACSENIDIQINRVLEQLRQMGELDNTYIFYTADHGMAIGRHGLQGKQNLYQHTWRVPFVAKGPGIPPGSRAEGNFYLHDVLATLCDLCGIPVPDSNEGLSFRSVLEGQKSQLRDTLYGVYSGGTKPGIRAIRQGDWKLIKYDVMDGAVRETQLFNLRDNPLEFLPEHHVQTNSNLTGVAPTSGQTNLADDPQYLPIRKNLEQLLLEEMQRLDDPSRLWDQPTIAATKPEVQQDRRPRNILFVIADDWGLHAGAYGTPWVKTPAFDQVASEGCLFLNAFTPVAKCAPSRAIILTGRHAWQNEAAGNHMAYFPESLKTWPEVLMDRGWNVGFTGKGWGPGIANDSEGKPRQLTGIPWNKRKLRPSTTGIAANDYAANFRDFLSIAPADQPWCFWCGMLEPHRNYEFQSGVNKGQKSLTDIDRVPAYWPDEEIIRHDMLDYALEVEHCDQQLGVILEELKSKGLLEQTLVIVTSDHGMPFPRVKGYAYHDSNHVPFAVRWPRSTNAQPDSRHERVIAEFIDFTDIAPTILEVAGISAEETGMRPLTGESLVPLINAGKYSKKRDHVLVGKERTDVGRPGDVGYPIRGILTSEYLYLQNYEPSRWPAGNPETGYLDTDGSPTKTRILEMGRRDRAGSFWRLNFGRRSSEELFDLKTDRDCTNDLSKNSAVDQIRLELRSRMEEELKSQNDPRMLGNGDIFDSYPPTNGAGFYEKFRTGEPVNAGWVNPSDFEPEVLE